MLPECAAWPVKGDGVALDAESPEHRPERPIEIEQDRALLDVQFQISGCVRQLFAALLHLFEIDPVLFERGGKGDALFVAQRARFIHVEMAGAGGRSEKAFAKSRAFLIRPIDETDCYRWPAVVLRIDAAKNLDAGQGVQTAIEPAAVRDGIDVSADEERPGRFTPQRRPKVPGFIGPNIRAERFEFLRSQARAFAHVSVKATRCAPFSSPVSSRSSFNSATVRFGSRAVVMMRRD